MRLAKRGGAPVFRQAKDKKKSQEYFLSLVDPSVLSSLVFPLGDFTKEEVKNIVQQENIVFQRRKESQDVCFVRSGSYGDFIERNACRVEGLCGPIRHLNGKVLGSHKGIHRFTYGQREGLGVSWTEPLYVVDIEPQTNTVIVAEKKSLLSDTFSVRECNWFVPFKEDMKLSVKVRYNCPQYSCRLKKQEKGLLVHLDKPLKAATPGQIACFYEGEYVVGAGVIDKVYGVSMNEG